MTPGGHRHILPVLVFHGVRGSLCASSDHQQTISEAGIIPSMSREGDRWDNAAAESFFATISE